MENNNGFRELKESNFPFLWEKWVEKIKDAFSSDVSLLVLRDFGIELLSQKFKNKPLHHLAIYVGDYVSENTVDALYEFLQQKIGSEIKSLERGPSYIAPRQYGTPGWWFTILSQENYLFELFCCRTFGGWRHFSLNLKQDLMSHVAIGIDSKESLLEYMRELEDMEGLSKIAFTERDELGHTYVHFKNLSNNKVLELIHIEAIQATGVKG